MKLAILITLLFFPSLQSTYGLSYTFCSLNILLIYSKRDWISLLYKTLSVVIYNNQKNLGFSLPYELMSCLSITVVKILQTRPMWYHAVHCERENFTDCIKLFSPVGNQCVYYMLNSENVIDVHRQSDRIGLLKVSVQENNGISVF